MLQFTLTTVQAYLIQFLMDGMADLLEMPALIHTYLTVLLTAPEISHRQQEVHLLGNALTLLSFCNQQRTMFICIAPHALKLELLLAEVMQHSTQ